MEAVFTKHQQKMNDQIRIGEEKAACDPARMLRDILSANMDVAEPGCGQPEAVQHEETYHRQTSRDKPGHVQPRNHIKQNRKDINTSIPSVPGDRFLPDGTNGADWPRNQRDDSQNDVRPEHECPERTIGRKSVSGGEQLVETRIRYEIFGQRMSDPHERNDSEHNDNGGFLFGAIFHVGILSLDKIVSNDK